MHTLRADAAQWFAVGSLIFWVLVIAFVFFITAMLAKSRLPPGPRRPE